MPTISIPVSQGIDDGIYQHSTDMWRTGFPDGDMGYWGPDIGAYSQALRFLNVQVPKGSTINSAVLRVRVCTSGEILSNIVGIAEGNCSDFTTNPIPRPETSAKVPWDGGKPYGWITSPDISAIIQEIVNRPDWAPGNAIGLKWLDDGSTDYCSINHYERDPELAAVLEITYTPVAPPPTHRLRVESEPISVPVTLNGAPIGNTPVEADVEEGAHEVGVPEEATAP